MNFTSFFGLLLLCLLSSCATLLNKKTERIIITHDNTIKQVKIENSTRDVKDSTLFCVTRSKSPLKIEVLADSSNKTVYVSSVPSLAFYSNLFIGLYGLPGMLIDAQKDKSFAYPRRIFLLKKDNAILVNPFQSPKKGTVRFNLWVSPIGTNSLRLKTLTNDDEAVLGLFAFESGFDYFLKKNQYLSLNAGLAEGTRHSGPNNYRYDGTKYISIRNNYVYKKTEWGYGVCFSKNLWGHKILTQTTDTSYSRSSSTLGLSFSGQYFFSHVISLKCLYQPYLLSINSEPRFSYQYLIGLGVAFTFRVKGLLW